MWRPTPEQARAWAEAWGTPFYAYDFAVAQGRAARLRAATSGAVQIWYALKANPNRALLEALAGVVDGADVASEGELLQARASGLATIGFTGPAKSPAAHRAALEAEARISVESLAELEALAEVARESGRVAKVSLRINPAERRHAFRVPTGGVAGPFGIDEADLEAAVDLARARSSLACDGVHVHAGSACSSAGAWHRHAVATFDLAARAAGRGLPLRQVNLGGGLASASEGLDVQALGRKLAGSAKKFRSAFGPVEIVLEPGRYLVADAGCFVCRVVRRVESRGEVVVVLDGGLNGYLFGTERFHDGPPPTVVNLSRPEAPASAPARLVGPTCTPLDRFGALPAPDPRPGDLLALGPAGGYGFSASPHLFLGHDSPAELAWVDGEVRCIRPRRRLADFD